MKSSLSLSSLNKKIDSYKDGTIAMFQSLKTSCASKSTFEDVSRQVQERQDWLNHRLNYHKYTIYVLIVTNVLSLLFNFI